MSRKILLIGAPVDSGKRRRGCLMGPDAYRTARLPGALADLGHEVRDLGNLAPVPTEVTDREGLHELPRTVGWTQAISDAARDAMAEGLPIFMGGDHALSLGSVHGVAAHAASAGRPQFVLWLDAHSDFHTFNSTESGNLHGTPLAYACGLPGFEGLLGRPLEHVVDPENVEILGVRSIDAQERELLVAHGVGVSDMRMIDEEGVAVLLKPFLKRVAEAEGLLHVSLDVDFLDPAIAPAVGTTVPGGATFREAHLVMEMLHDTGLVSSLDLVELNPFLDERGRTARLMVELTASLFGRRVFDRPTRSF